MCPVFGVQAVYDASPVVRAEVAVGLARLADSHSVLFQVRMTGLGVVYLVFCSLLVLTFK